MRLFYFLSACLLASAVSGSGVSYKGFKVLRVDVPNEYAALRLQNLQMLVDFWKDPRIGGHADIMVSPEMLDQIIGHLDEDNMEYSVTIPDVHTLMELQSKSARYFFILASLLS